MVTKPKGRRIRFMLIESIVRKTLGLKRHKVKKVEDKQGIKVKVVYCIFII
jgi:hypothetical protein